MQTHVHAHKKSTSTDKQAERSKWSDRFIFANQTCCICCKYVLTWVDRQVTDILAVGAGGDGELRPAIDMGVTFRTGSVSPWLADAETTAVAVDTVVWYPSCPAAIAPSPSASELSE